MRLLLTLALLLGAGLSTGASPALNYYRFFAFPPPNVPLSVAVQWRDALDKAKEASRANNHEAILRALDAVQQWPHRYGPSGMATRTLLYRGMAQVATYRYEPGLRDLLDARRLAETISDNVSLTSALSVLSNLYLHLSAFSEAERAAEQAVKSCDPASPQMVGLLIQQARLAARAGHLDQAIPLFRRSIELARKRGDSRLEVLGWRSLGLYLQRAQRVEEAEAALQEALRLGRARNDPGLSVTYRLLAELDIQRGRPQTASGFIDQAFEAYSPSRSGYPLWALHYARARALAANSELMAALPHYRLAVDQIQKTRWHLLPADALRVSSVAGAQEVFASFVDAAAELHLQTGNRALLTESFVVAETNRALSLRLTSAGKARLRQRLPAAYFRTLDALQSHYSGNYRDDSAAAQKQAEALRLQLTEMEASAGLQPYLAPVPKPENLRRRLLPHQAMVSFHLSEPKSYVWVMTRDQLSVHSSPGRSEIARRVVELREAIDRNSPHIAAIGSRLYSELLGPIAGPTRGKSHLLLLPDDLLFELPFAALRESAQSPYLIERFVLEVLPGAWAVEQQDRRLAWSGPFLGVGDPVYNPADERRPKKPFPASIWQANASAPATLSLPRLPGTASELNACARRIGLEKPELLLGSEARWERVRARLASEPGIIHFATHVVPSPDSPRESLLALSLRPNGEPELLTSELIAAHDVRSRLVVLSGCRSGSGNIKPGEGLMGLTRAWLLAGAQSVLATYWPTLDDTGSLLEAFYGSFSQQMPPAQALQAAQRAMIARSDFRAEPRYWASCFISSRGL